MPSKFEECNMCHGKRNVDSCPCRKFASEDPTHNNAVHVQTMAYGLTGRHFNDLDSPWVPEGSLSNGKSTSRNSANLAELIEKTRSIAHTRKPSNGRISSLKNKSTCRNSANLADVIDRTRSPAYMAAFYKKLLQRNDEDLYSPVGLEKDYAFPAVWKADGMQIEPLVNAVSSTVNEGVLNFKSISPSAASQFSEEAGETTSLQDERSNDASSTIRGDGASYRQVERRDVDLPATCCDDFEGMHLKASENGMSTIIEDDASVAIRITLGDYSDPPENDIETSSLQVGLSDKGSSTALSDDASFMQLEYSEILDRWEQRIRTQRPYQPDLRRRRWRQGRWVWQRRS